MPSPRAGRNIVDTRIYHLTTELGDARAALLRAGVPFDEGTDSIDVGIDRLVRQRDEALRALDVEAGEVAALPAGWRKVSGISDYECGEEGQVTCLVQRCESWIGGWRWLVFGPGDGNHGGELLHAKKAALASEAIELASVARDAWTAALARGGKRRSITNAVRWQRDLPTAPLARRLFVVNGGSGPWTWAYITTGVIDPVGCGNRAPVEHASGEEPSAIEAIQAAERAVGKEV